MSVKQSRRMIAEARCSAGDEIHISFENQSHTRGRRPLDSRVREDAA